jgi:hypothetical protein
VILGRRASDSQATMVSMPLNTNAAR